MPELPAGTVTFLFTDVEGSTKLLNELGDAYAEVLEDHRTKIRSAFSRHGGVEVDTQGDAFFVAFPRAKDALEAAAEARDALASGRVRVRIGLHTGEPLVTDEGYVGIDVHRAARIAAAGHGGQILVSQSTRDLVGADGLRDLGEHRLKDLSAPERIFQLGDADFPRLKTLDQTNLPIPATPFVGRERELAEVTELLEGEHVRLVTLTGPGGTGKTRLALQAIAAAADAYDAGVWWVPLAPIRDPELVLPTAARALGGGGDFATQVRDRRMLVLLDNFEHVVDAAGDIAVVLAECPHLDVVVTSRTPLRIAAEWDYAVHPLPEGDSAELFLQRARAARRDFRADGAVTEICNRLDNLPLAIELAAARVRVLDAPELLARLDRRLPILKGASRDAPERQRTLRATIEWSYDLLGPEEQQLFARLGVFVGGFTLDAAEDVCDADLDDLEGLVAQSLLRRWSNGRLGMLETIREYAVELLVAAEDEQEIRRGHAEHYLEIAEAANLSLESIARGLAQRPELVRPEQDNIRAAIDWATDNDEPELALRLALALAQLWILQDPREEVRRFELLIERAETVDVEIRARAMRDYGGSLDVTGDWQGAERAYAESGRLYRLAGNERGAAEADFRLGLCAVLYFHDAARASELWNGSRATFERLGDATGLLQVLGSLGALAFDEGDREQGRALMTQSLDMAREADWPWFEAVTLSVIADRELVAGNNDEAERRASEALDVALQIDDRGTKFRAVVVIARVALARGDVRRAASLWAALRAEAARVTVPRWDILCERHGAVLDQLTAPAEPPAFDEAVQLARGQQNG